jgi:NAD(P)-dependent dehydrogenase (short-subunit alcohol dehydrogenase family)
MEVEDLSGKTAVVTGASRGIGRAIAGELARAGARVVISARGEKALEEAREEISSKGGECKALACDHADPGSIEAFAQEVLGSWGAPDILVNNAGEVRFGGKVADMDLESWNAVIGTNLTGVFLTTRAFLPAMIEKDRGDIFMISSMSGKKGDPGASAYAASKFGLQGFSQALNYEVRRNNIRVMVLNPSSVDTGPEPDRTHGPGLHLHARDIARTVVHLACLPGRTLLRDMDIWGTNPY